jgi:hypothetical protein
VVIRPLLANGLIEVLVERRRRADADHLTVRTPRCRFSAGQVPRNLGVRLSWKASTPSRKSSDWRRRL